MSITYFTPFFLILQLLLPLALVHLLSLFVIPYPLPWRLSHSVSNRSQLWLKYSNPLKSTLVSCSRFLPIHKSSILILYITRPPALSDRAPYFPSSINIENKVQFLKHSWHSLFYFFIFYLWIFHDSVFCCCFDFDCY